MTASAPLTIYPALRNHRIPQKKKRDWLYGSSRKLAGQAVYGGSPSILELLFSPVKAFQYFKKGLASGNCRMDLPVNFLSTKCSAPAGRP